MIRTLRIKKRNFKTKPFSIDLLVDGVCTASLWSKTAHLRRFNFGSRWWVCDSNLDIFIHADEVVFEEAK